MTDSQKQILDLIFAATHQIFYDYDVASGAIQWRGQVQQVLGYSLEEMTGGVDQWMDLIHPEDRDEALRQLEIAEKAVGAYEVEYRFRRRDGEYLWMRDRGIYQGDETGKAVRMIGLQEDISDRKRAEAISRDMEERYRVLVERVQGAVFFIQEGKFVFSNEAFAKIIGYTPEEVIGRSFVDYVAPESLETVRDNYRRRVAGEDVPNEYEAYLLHKNGEHRLTVISAGPATVQGKVGSLGTIIDITEQRRNEQALREAAERQRLILETSPTAMLITRIDGTVLFANKRLTDLLGLDASDLAGANIPDFYDDPAERQIVLAKIRQQGHLEDYELRVRRPDGSLAWALLSVRLFEFGGERVLLSALVDITGRKLADAERERQLTIINASSDFIGLADLDGKGLYLNPAGLAMTGYTAEEFYGGMGIASFQPDLPSEIIGLAIQHGAWSGEANLTHRDGRKIPVLQSIIAIKDTAGNLQAIATIARDITALKQAQLKSAESEATFRSLFEQSADASLFLENGIFTDCNAAAVEMMRAENKSQFLATHPSVLSPEFQPDGRPSGEKADEMIAIALEKGRHRFEWVHRRVNGEDFPAEVLLTPIRLSGDRLVIYTIWRDISERKRAEAEVRLQKERLQSIAANVPGVVYQFYALPTGELGLTYVSERAAEVFELEGNIETFFPAFVAGVHPEDQAGFMASIQAAIATASPWNFEGRFVRHSGEIVWFSGTSTPTLLADRVVFNGLLLDVTERKQAEAAILQEKNFSDTVINSLPGVFYLFDTQGRLIRWNRNYEALLGLTTEEVSRRNALDAIVEEDRPQVASAIQQVFTEGQDAIEARVRSKDGLLLPYYFTGIRLQIGGELYAAGSGINIADRKRAEEELRVNEERFRRMAETIPDGLTIFEGSQVVYMNERLVQILGYSKEELTRMSSFDYAAPEEVERLKAQAQEVRQSGRPLDQLAFWAIRKDGERRFIRNRYAVFTDQNQKVLGRVVITTDETERIALEQQVQQSYERRGLQVQLGTQVAQDIAAATDLQSLYERVVTQVKERFGYYHVQILRFDPAANAVLLIMGYGEVGAQMLAASHRLPMGMGLIGAAAATGQTVLRPDLKDDLDWRPNPLLPDTRGEIAVPIKLGEHILGVLDVQSAESGALGADDQWLLEGLCGQIAIAIEDTRLRQEMSARLQELDTLYRAASREGWDAVRRAGLFPSGYRFNQTDVFPLEDSWTYADPVAAVEPQRPVTVSPLTVRGGEVIGTLGVLDDPQKPLSPEDQSLIEQISEQVALALESARLFAQTQATLGQTEALYTASERVVRADTIDGVLAAVIKSTDLQKFDHGAILLFDHPWAETLPDIGLVAAIWEKDGEPILPVGVTFPIAEYPFSRNLQRDTPLYIENIMTDKRVDEKTRQLMHPLGVSTAIFPLVVGDQWIGWLSVAGHTPVEIAPDQLRQIGSLVGQAATVIQSIRLYDQTQAALSETQTLYRLTSRLTAAADLQDVVAIAAEEFHIPVVNRSVLLLFEYDSHGQIAAATVRANWHSGQGAAPTPVGTLYAEAVLSQVLVAMLRPDPLFVDETDELTRQQGISSMAVLPLWIGGRQAGVLLMETEVPHHFTDTERRPAAALAQQVTIAVQSRLLFDQVRTALAATERSQQFLRTLIDNIPNPIFFKDTRGAYIGFNRAFLDYLGKTEEELLGKTVFELQTDQELAARYHQMDADLFENPGVQVYESRVRYADGSLRDVIFNKATFENADGSLGGLVGTMVDITDRKQVEVSLRESQVRLSEALDIARLAYWEFDFVTGMFTFDQKYYDMLGITADEEGGYSMTAQRFAEVYTHPAEAAIVGAEIQKALETTDPEYSRQFESRNLRKDGTPVDVSVRFRVIKDADGRTIRMVGANQDITDRKRAEAVIARRARELSLVAQISTTISSILDPDQMLQIAVDLTRQSFAMYHAHIYLLNDAEDALVLAAGAGDVGRKMSAQGWQIALNREKSVVARCARTRQGVIVNDVRSDPGFLPNELLPETRAEMAVPLIIGNQVIGVLDVQSDVADRFSEEDINIQTTLAVQIAVTLQNARTYAQTQRQAEHEALINAISQKIQSTTSVETALQVAVRELGRALGASKTSVQLGLQRHNKP